MREARKSRFLIKIFHENFFSAFGKEANPLLDILLPRFISPLLEMQMNARIFDSQKSPWWISKTNSKLYKTHQFKKNNNFFHSNSYSSIHSSCNMNSIHVVIRFFVIRLCEAYFDILPRQIVKSLINWWISLIIIIERLFRFQTRELGHWIVIVHETMILCPYLLRKIRKT